MKVAVLSCGPSLAYSWSPNQAPAYDRILAINQSANDHPCHWAIAADRDAALKIERPPLIGFVWRSSFSPDAPQLGDVHPLCIGGRLGVVDAVKLPVLDAFKPPTFSIQDALLFAHYWLGATEIDLYGCDMAGSGGSRLPDTDHCRDNARWRLERPLFDKAVAYLRGNGTTVRVRE